MSTCLYDFNLLNVSNFLPALRFNSGEMNIFHCFANSNFPSISRTSFRIPYTSEQFYREILVRLCGTQHGWLPDPHAIFHYSKNALQARGTPQHFSLVCSCLFETFVPDRIVKLEYLNSFHSQMPKTNNVQVSGRMSICVNFIATENVSRLLSHSCVENCLLFPLTLLLNSSITSNSLMQSPINFPICKSQNIT
jgi:hypothetical protein